MQGTGCRRRGSHSRPALRDEVVEDIVEALEDQELEARETWLQVLAWR